MALATFGVILATTDKKRKRFKVDHQLARLNYGLQTEFLSLDKSACGEEVVTFYTDEMASRGMRYLKYFDTVAPEITGAPKKLTAKIAKFSKEPEFYDKNADAMNKNGEQLISMMDMREKQGIKSIAEFVEEQFYGADNADTNEDRRVNGLQEFLRLPRLSDGTLVLQRTPKANGVYVRRPDGVTDAKYLGVDRSLATGVRSNMCASSDSFDLTREDLETLDEMATYSEFAPAPMTRLGQEVGDLALFCGTQDQLKMKRLQDRISADRGIIGADAKRIGEMRIVRAAIIDEDPKRPIFGMRLSQIETYYSPDCWLKRTGPWPHYSNPEDLFFYRYKWFVQQMASDPRRLGFAWSRVVAGA